jgi:hypothetical protein
MPHRGHGTRGSRQKDALIDGLNREFVEKLATDVESATTEHGFGLAGGEPLNKNSDGDVTTIVTNSPGAVAAAAGRDVHQKVQHQTYATLIQSLDEILVSDEFQRLEQEHQEEVRDLTETVREAASEKQPDPKKVARRGQRLIKALQELGMSLGAHMLTGALAHVLTATPAA